MEEIWDRIVDIQLVPSKVVISKAVEDSSRDDASTSVLVNISNDASFTTATVNSLMGSETTDGSSSFVKDGFDQSDLDSLEAEIARELED